VAIKKFSETSAASAVILLTAIAALFAANIFGNGYASAIKPLVNNYLIAIFFFVVGQELRQEFNKSLALPSFAALGGMIAPALIYKSFSSSSDWVAALPTDIALVLGAAMILKVSPALRIFLLALALSDDLLSIGLIAVRGSLDLLHLLPTVGATILGLLLPLKFSLQKISDLIIVPLFIFVNLGFEFIAPSADAWTLAASRTVGKTIGITLFAYIAIKLGARSNVSLREIATGGALAGMGLTVALYLADSDQVKIGLLIAIILSALVAKAIAPRNQ
jgi:NhaA family Na+:H+ antiporter